LPLTLVLTLRLGLAGRLAECDASRGRDEENEPRDMKPVHATSVDERWRFRGKRVCFPRLPETYGAILADC
jgi:hypothetical protein